MSRELLPAQLVVSIGLLLAVTASSASAAAKAVVREPIVDVGTVAKGEQIEHSFELRNEGDAVLTVREVKPACGCTIAKYDKSIAAGATGKIAAVVKTENFTGPIAKSVTVFTSDSSNPRINLVIKAVIQPQVEVQPGYARFIVVEGSGTESSTQTLWTAQGPDLEIRSVRSPYPFVKAGYRRLDTGEAETGSRWEVSLSLDRNGAPVGPLADFIEVETNHPKQRVIKIPVSGFVRPEVSVTPRVAELGSRRLETPFTTTLEVRNQTNTTISLSGATADVAGIDAEIEEVEAGKVYKVVLTLQPEMAKGPFKGKVQITTSSKRRPLLEVDLSGTVL
ncbi:MAG: DUF1573 domain-containing protein [bacterium]|nr:DUF1573 domain-containing protein [bacterium]